MVAKLQVGSLQRAIFSWQLRKRTCFVLKMVCTASVTPKKGALMKSKSRFAAILATLALALSLPLGLTGCGGSKDTSSSDSTSKTETTSSSSSTDGKSSSSSGTIDTVKETDKGVLDALAGSDTYESILDDYSKQIADATPGLIEEYNSEAAASDGTIDAKAQICNDKVSELAKISNDGVSEMAQLMYRKGDEYSTYEEWSGKLYDVYMEYAGQIQDAYMDSCQ